MSRANQPHISFTDFNEDNIINLPDLSSFPEDERRHIIDVLIRDENLRSKHLERFMNLRKEVADLEQQPPPASATVCARCQTPFGYLFNTGDACPKCDAKVCKQCRSIYNVNDNNWLCTLCCKQMQLISYSGEWIYALRSNLRKPSTSLPEMHEDSFPLSVSTQNINMESSSDSERENQPQTTKSDRFSKNLAPTQQAKSKGKPKDKASTMIVQNSADEQKLKYLKERMKERPLNAPDTQPLPRRVPQITLTNNTFKTSSDAVNRLSNSTNNIQDGMPNKTIQQLRKEKQPDLISVTSSEWGPGDDDSDIEKENGRGSQAELPPPSIRGSRLSVSSTAKAKKPRHKRISASMQSLRDKVHRIPHPHLSSSRTSLNSQKTATTEIPANSSFDTEDTLSPKVKDFPNKSESRTDLSTPQTSIDESKPAPVVKNRHQSVNSVATTKSNALQPLGRHVSTSESIKSGRTDYTRQDSRPDSIGQCSSIIDSGDDIDDAVTKSKSKSGPKRATSLKDIRGSRLSLNTLMSEKKARFDLAITGTIELRVSYHKNTGSLDVYIKQCTNLVAAKRHQASDPYCKVYLLPDQSQNSKRKTTVRKGTTSPVFAETLRYHLSEKDFNKRTLWISVWSETKIGHNDFLGEVRLELAHCKFDELQEHSLKPRPEKDEEETAPVEQPVQNPEISFELNFIPHTTNKEMGTIQVNKIQLTGISYHGKSNIDVVCKGLLMPDKAKKKLPTILRGPSPTWDIPLRWENIRLKDIRNTSIQISVWTLERFRKSMIGFVNLNLSRGHLDSRDVKLLHATDPEKAKWNAFLNDPARMHRIHLQLRLSAGTKA